MLMLSECKIIGSFYTCLLDCNKETRVKDIKHAKIIKLVSLTSLSMMVISTTKAPGERRWQIADLSSNCVCMAARPS